LICYETAIALSGKDDTTLAKFLIISLEDATTANWYSRLPPRSIYILVATTQRKIPDKLSRVPRKT
jgi:hypothetical protein